MVAEIIIAFVVGAVTNLATNWLWDWIKERNNHLKKPETSAADFPKLEGGAISSKAEAAEASRLSLIRRLTVTGWGMMPLGYTMAIIYLVEHRWPLPMTEVIWLLVGGIIVNLVMLAIGLLISLNFPRIGWSLGLMIIAVAIELSALYMLVRRVPHYISLDCPAQVESMEIIRGRVVDPNWRVYVLIRPYVVGNQYPMEPTYPGEDGVWSVRGSFSGESGSKYEVIALALPSDQADNPNPKWLLTNAMWKTSACEVVNR
jgi:hypothetical protein